MKGFVQDIEDLAVKNSEFRRVLYTVDGLVGEIRAIGGDKDVHLGAAHRR